MHEISVLLLKTPFGSLFQDTSITDISYNGTCLFYLSSTAGRMKYIDYDHQEAMNLMRQIANLSNQLFTYQNPVLDVVFDRYRLSAVHPFISREGEKEVVSFAIRIVNQDKDLLERAGMITPTIKDVLMQIILSQKSIVISGLTGVGKTELQKYLIGCLAANTRLIIVDQGVELAILQKVYPHLDITMWRFDERLTDSSLAGLIKTSLRFNPDYLVIAEARGKEINEIYNAALSGHPSFFTMHSEDVTSVHQRMLAMGTSQNGIRLTNLVEVFPYVIQIEKKENELGVIRKITKIVKFVQGQKSLTYLYHDE